MPGPLPDPDARRRNKPTIPTTSLPAGGRQDPPPELPDFYAFRGRALAWWNWAWATPQAAAWDDGVLYVVARRAQLEDDLEALEDADGFNLEDLLLGYDDDIKGQVELGKHVEFLIRKLKGLAGGRVSVMKEMRELDNRLGLNPEAMAKLRWKIVDDSDGDDKSKSAGVTALNDYREQLSA